MSIHESSVRRACASAVVVLGVAAVAFSTAGGAETRVVGVAGSDSNTVLTRQVADLQMRVNKLERTLIDVQRTLKKPDTPDDGGGSDKPDKKGAGGGKDANASGSNTNAGGGGGNAGDTVANTAGGGTGAKDSGPAGGGKPDSPSKGSGTDARKDPVPTMTVRAPFLVVDSAGKTILRVNDPHASGGKSGGERGVYIYGDAGVANFQLTTVFAGAKLAAVADSGEYVATFGAVGTDAGIRIRKGKNVRAFVGMDSRGKGNIAISTSDDDATSAALQSTDDGKGMVAVFNSNKPVAFLTESTSGGGNVTATDPAGNGVFSAGHLNGDDGETCVNRKHKTHCLGVGLPLGGGQ